MHFFKQCPFVERNARADVYIKLLAPIDTDAMVGESSCPVKNPYVSLFWWAYRFLQCNRDERATVLPSCVSRRMSIGRRQSVLAESHYETSHAGLSASTNTLPAVRTNMPRYCNTVTLYRMHCTLVQIR